MKNLLQKAKMSFIGKVWPILKLKKIWIPLAVILLIFGYSRMGQSQQTKQVKLEPTTFVQQVLLTGKVVANNHVSMGFESSGRVSAVNVKIGDVVQKGQTLASISNGDSYASVQQKRALVDVENAKLSEVLRGSRPEDIAIAESNYSNAKLDADQSAKSLVDQIKDAYAKSDDVVRSKVDQLYTNPTSGYPQIIGFHVPTGSANITQKLTNERIVAGERLAKWRTSTMALTATNITDANVLEAQDNLSFMRDYLNDMTIAVVGLESNASMNSTTINGYRSDISNARTTISSAISSLNDAESDYKDSAISLERSKNELALKKNGSTVEDIASQRAELKSAEAALASAQALFSKTIITAPFDGVITKVDLDPGEISSPNTPVIDLMGGGQYQIESFVSESDIAKIKPGQIAFVTLDAYGKDQKFEATVVNVDPSETIVDGVSTYKTTFVFKDEDSRIKSGMTANITVKTDERSGAIIIPQNALYLLNGEKMVDVLVDGKAVTKKVATGGLDAEGDLLIISGLNEGDVIQIKK